MNKHGEILHQTPLKEVSNLRWYIQHLMDQKENEAENPLCEQNWMKQANWKFIKYVIHHKHSRTPEQVKQKPFEEFSRNNMKQESTTSSENSKQDSDSDTSTEDEEESNTIETAQVHHVMHETPHEEEKPSEAEDDTSQDENVAEMQTYENNGEENVQEDKLLSTNFELEVETRKVGGLITYSTDQQIFKFKVNSGTDQEVWGVYIDFQSIHSK